MYYSYNLHFECICCETKNYQPTVTLYQLSFQRHHQIIHISPSSLPLQIHFDGNHIYRTIQRIYLRAYSRDLSFRIPLPITIPDIISHHRPKQINVSTRITSLEAWSISTRVSSTFAVHQRIALKVQWLNLRNACQQIYQGGPACKLEREASEEQGADVRGRERGGEQVEVARYDVGGRGGYERCIDHGERASWNTVAKTT